MIITAIKRLTLVALFGGVTIAGMTALVTDQSKADQMASIEVSRAQNTLELEQAQAMATMTALDAQQNVIVLETAQLAEKAAQTHQIELKRQAILAPIWTGAKAVFIALGTSSACFVVYAGMASYYARREPLISIRNIPITRDVTRNHAAMLDLIRDDQNNSALVRVEQARASVNVPHHYAPSTTYSPRYAYEYENTVTNDSMTQETEAAQAARVPTFGQMMRAGTIGAGQKAIIYGFTDQQKLYEMSIEKLTSTLIFGNSGSGKTTTLANLIGQLALNSFDLQIVDPHFGHDESLSARLAPLGIDQTAIAHDEKAIEAQARKMLSLLEQAKQSGNDCRTAWIIDEVTAVFRYSCAGIVQQALEAIAQEGRKYKLVAYAASQATRANRFGDSSVRDSFPIIAIHRLRRSALRNVGLTSSDEFARVEKLAVGVFLLDDGKNEPKFLTAPLIESSDLAQIGGAGSGHLSLPISGNNTTVTGNLTSSEVENKEVEAGPEVGAEVGTHDQKVTELLKEGISQRQIIQEVWGVSGGRKYQEAAKEISQIIANAL